jgi:all-trans-8'-apo-beta-carotenal 15,15'-oxygenase
MPYYIPLLMCFAEDGSLRCAPERYTLPGVTIALIHDLVVTEDYYVISLGPIDFDFGKFVTQYMTSRCSIAECMEYKPTEKPSTVHLVPRPGGKAGELAVVLPDVVCMR